jgi:hypothetical protein
MLLLVNDIVIFFITSTLHRHSVPRLASSIFVTYMVAC